MKPNQKPRFDPATQFILNASKDEDVVAMHVNALINTPFFSHLDQCLALAKLGETGGKFDATRDIDQVIATNLGTIVTGFFDDGTQPLPICRNPTPEGSYRGFTLFSCGDDYYGQGNAVLVRSSGMQVRGMIDDMLDPPPASADPSQLRGDIYGHWELNDLDPMEPTDPADQALVSVLSQLSDLTIRADVWDSAKLSIEGVPRSGVTELDVDNAAASALASVRGQIDSSDLRFSALSDLSNLKENGGKLETGVTLPTEALTKWLNELCKREMTAHTFDKND